MPTRGILDQLGDLVQVDPSGSPGDQRYFEDDYFLALGKLDLPHDTPHAEESDEYYQRMIRKGITPGALEKAVNEGRVTKFAEANGLGYDDIRILMKRWGIDPLPRTQLDHVRYVRKKEARLAETEQNKTFATLADKFNA
jgi:hypothetical protein